METTQLFLEKPITPEEEKMIQEEFEGLLLDYSNTRKGDKADLIREVFAFAKRAHGNERRKSGEPYICHPLAVARIVSKDIGMGSTTISAALLHDVVKETDVSFEDIDDTFGQRIGNLVRGLTKISGGNMRFVTEETSDETHHALKNPEEQAEKFRNLLLTMSEDVRVVLVKIADRLHNMRTLNALSNFKQKRIAQETLYLFSPLAYRLGLFKIKSELEDLSLKFEHPEEYEEIKHLIKDSEESRERLFATFSAPIVSMVDSLGLKYTLKYRMKSIYSIWKKMTEKHVPFDEIYDLFAARIVFTPQSPETEKQDSWRIYAAITSVYKIHPNRIRDWISSPKSNGYEALHVTLMGPNGNWIEMQIRSERMDETAEKGLAAHWKYKDGNKAIGNENIKELDKWVRSIKDILDNPEPNATDFLDTIKLNLLSTEIYVFTPKGDLKELPKGASALDFAFALHTKIGMRAEAARINHQIMPLSTILESGQQVEIICSEEDKIKPEWKSIVYTSKARSKIQNHINKQRREKAEPGQEKLAEYVKKCGYVLNNEIVINLLNKYNLKSWEDLFIMIEEGEIKLDNKLRKALRPSNHSGILGFLHIKNINPLKKKKKPETEEAQKTKADLMREAHERKQKEEKAKSSTIELSGIDERGLLNTITRIIADMSAANIINIHLECKEGVFKGYITLDTGDSKIINSMCSEMKKVHGIKKAIRIS
ncbi:MAG: bifunctional (p)ppGpp synthetase/guanosine-3',5'-bis(diphosphate) 3'-pyrophosphohydrolase [Bacteroidales bacterium]|nr:bifunctional (p)ppGpp synthetase/guanosine-3',5'-bis(diphosphate) 3'-pyrophosphohydrolase [Bacteroidales bacterium]